MSSIALLYHLLAAVSKKSLWAQRVKKKGWVRRAWKFLLNWNYCSYLTGIMALQFLNLTCFWNFLPCHGVLLWVLGRHKRKLSTLRIFHCVLWGRRKIDFHLVFWRSQALIFCLSTQLLETLHLYSQYLRQDLPWIQEYSLFHHHHGIVAHRAARVARSKAPPVLPHHPLFSIL